MDYLNLVGLMAATLTTISFVPQVVKVVQTKSTHDISLSMFIIFMIGILLWLVYGVMIESWPIIVGNTITTGLAGTILFYKLKFK